MITIKEIAALCKRGLLNDCIFFPEDTAYLPVIVKNNIATVNTRNLNTLTDIEIKELETLAYYEENHLNEIKPELANSPNSIYIEEIKLDDVDAEFVSKDFLCMTSTKFFVSPLEKDERKKLFVTHAEEGVREYLNDKEVRLFGPLP